MKGSIIKSVVKKEGLEASKIWMKDTARVADGYR